MTAVNAIISAGLTGYMLTDCAICEPDGEIYRVANKAISLPHAQTVIAVRGSVIFQHVLLIDLQYLEGFDQIVSSAGGNARKRWKSLPSDHRGDGADFIARGWAEARGRVVAALCHHSDGFEPVFSDGIITPGVEASQLGGSVESYLLRTMEEQRRVYRKGEGSAVGGAAILTTVTRCEITQRVLHRWNDEIGSTIKPDTGP
jgi:hypothetical protein